MSDSTNTSTNTSPSIAVSMNMTLLKKDVTATYDVSSTIDNGLKTKTVITKTLVMPGSIKPGSETDGFTIKDFVDEVNKIAGNSGGVNQTEIQNQIINAGNITDKGILDGISIVLKEIFFYHQSTKIYEQVSPGNYSDTPKDAGTSSFEYAFDIEIENKNFFKNDIFTINSLSFSIWNTTRKKIIDTMNLTNIDDILKDENMEKV